MTEQGQNQPDGAATHYDVVLLVEQALSAADATQVRSLHVGIEEQVRYHVVLPVEDAALRVEAALGSMSTGEVLSPPAAPMADVDVDAVGGGGDVDGGLGQGERVQVAHQLGDVQGAQHHRRQACERGGGRAVGVGVGA